MVRSRVTYVQRLQLRRENLKHSQHLKKPETVYILQLKYST
jgi:hypothetical protein